MGMEVPGAEVGKLGTHHVRVTSTTTSTTGEHGEKAHQGQPTTEEGKARTRKANVENSHPVARPGRKASLRCRGESNDTKVAPATPEEAEALPNCGAMEKALPKASPATQERQRRTSCTGEQWKTHQTSPATRKAEEKNSVNGFQKCSTSPTSTLGTACCASV